MSRLCGVIHAPVPAASDRTASKKSAGTAVTNFGQT